MTVLVPIRREDARLEDRLRRLLNAARSVNGRLLLAVDARTPESVITARRVASRAPDVRVAMSEGNGKFRALRDAVAGLPDGVLVLADADVVLGADALPALIEPLRTGAADVCAARVHVAPRAGGRVTRTLEALNYRAWHILRATRPASAWSLSGQLYAMRVEMFPSRIPVATVDDGCIGLALRARGAVFAYVPRADVWHPAPRGYLAWIRQKFRYRRGWARLAATHPDEVRELERDLRASLSAAAAASRLARLVLKMHFAAMRYVALALDAVAPIRRPDWSQAR